MREQIEELIKKPEFSDFGKQGDYVIKFNDKHENKNISKIYIDYSDNILESSEEMLKRHKDIVEQDFYKSSGSLQWNFYYYFVFNKENYEKIKNSAIAREIESDTSYSRKKIVSLETLESSYPFASILEEVNSKKTTYSDLSHSWIKILKENDLDEVYSEDKDATFDKVIDRYVDGRPIKEVIENNLTSESSSIDSPHSIKSIKLKKYRSFPQDTQFIFKGANLIEGVNGRGKTSLLESIELLMCGKTFRHDKSENADISLDYGSGIEENYDPKNTKKFQSREQFWYGIPATHNKNTLYTNFNRFNFFNTDASYRFSQSDEANVIWKSFKALALGGNTAELEKRLKGFEERFLKRLKQVSNEKTNLEAEIKDLINKKNQIKTPSNINEPKDARVSRFLSDVGASLLIDYSLESSVAQVSSFFSRSLNKVNRILEEFSSEQSPTIRTIKLINEKTLLVESSLQNLNNILDNIGKKKIELNSKIKTIQGREKSLDRLRQYLNHSDAFNIRKIEENLFKLSSSNLNDKEILNALSDLDLLEEKDDPANLSIRLSELEQSVAVDSRSRDELDHLIKKNKEAFEGLKEVVLEIKTLGRRFLLLSKSHECPLCETSLTRAILEEKISQINIGESDLSQLLENRQNLEDKIKKDSEKLSVLRKINRALSQYSGPADCSIKDAKSLLRQKKESFKASVESHRSQEKIYNNLLEQGFSVNQLLTLAGELGIDTSKSKELTIPLFEETASNISNQLNVLKEELRQIESEEESLKNKFLIDFSNINIEQFDSASIQKIFSSCNKVKQGYKELNDLILDLPRLDHNLSLYDLRNTLKDYHEDLISYQAFLEKVKQETATLKQLDEQIESKGRTLEVLSLKFQRLDKAARAFDRIQKEFGVDEAIAKFFTENKGIIVNIFKAIHTPNEFEDLDISDEKIYVLKNGQRRELNTISTGQRTAVALSIFLGMHLSCPMAPKIILLDDPIAFVDDLNVLAVLDFLRELVIKGERQLFFATANKKLASLFKRKFDLIPESLAVINPNVNL